jgi:hypothetical protein
MAELHDPKPEALCPICGWNQWITLPFGVGQGFDPAPAGIKAFRSEHEIGAAPFACERCGFVRFHVKRAN